MADTWEEDDNWVVGYDAEREERNERWRIEGFENAKRRKRMEELGLYPEGGYWEGDIWIPNEEIYELEVYEEKLAFLNGTNTPGMTGMSVEEERAWLSKYEDILKANRKFGRPKAKNIEHAWFEWEDEEVYSARDLMAFAGRTRWERELPKIITAPGVFGRRALKYEKRGGGEIWDLAVPREAAPQVMLALGWDLEMVKRAFPDFRAKESND